MLNFSSIAIFILATTKPNMGGNQQDYATYFESRLLPIASTWGSLFPHFYFVMGTNKFDYKFVTSKCRLSENSFVDGKKRRRRLAPHTPQTVSRNAIEKYECSMSEEERRLHQMNRNLSSPSPSSSLPLYSKATKFNVLFTANCTGEYFGLGPTCRCQESLRYFSNEPTVQSVEWFLFLDDDTYIRPYALLSMLESLSNNNNNNNNNLNSDSSNNNNQIILGSEPLAMVAPANFRSFDYSRVWKGIANCAVSGVHEFLMAQPALLNR